MPKIDEMYAFVTEDSSPDDEGLVGFQTDGGWMPMVGADMKMVEKLKPVARQIAGALHKKIKILKFTKREEIGVI